MRRAPSHGITWLFALPLLFVLGGTVTAVTAGAVVPSSRAGTVKRNFDANAVKPASCAALSVTKIVTGTGSFAGTSASELLLGSAAVDSVDGGSGNDCLLGGDSADTVNGGQGTDVCIGGPGIDVFLNCETQIQ